MRRPGGSIVTISSIAALAGGGDSYSGAKAALIGWTLDLAVRLRPDGIRASAVVPGCVQGTEFFGDRMTEERRTPGRRTLSAVPVRPMTSPVVSFPSPPAMPPTSPGSSSKSTVARCSAAANWLSCLQQVIDGH